MVVGCVVGGLVAGMELAEAGIVRIRAAERVLLAELGDGYRRYADSHHRVIPGVW